MALQSYARFSVVDLDTVAFVKVGHPIFVAVIHSKFLQNQKRVMSSDLELYF